MSFTDRQRQLVEDLLDEYISKITGLQEIPDRIVDLLSEEHALALAAKHEMQVRPADPELERLLNEEEEIELFALFQSEVASLTGEPCSIGFNAWRRSPLNPHKASS